MSKKEIAITLGVVVLALASILVGYQLGWSPLAGDNPPGSDVVPAVDYSVEVDTSGQYTQDFSTTGVEEGFYTVKVAAGPEGTDGANVYTSKRVYIGSVSTCTNDAVLTSTCSCGGTIYETGYCCNGGFRVAGSDSTNCNYGIVDGLLNDSSANPIVSDSFVLSGANNQSTITLSTDISGSFSSSSIPADTYTVRMADGSSYALSDVSFSLNSGEHQTYTWTVDDPVAVGDIVVSFIDQDSVPMNNVYVEILGPDGQGDWRNGTDSGAETSVSFLSVETGNYEIRGSAEGFDLSTTSVVVNDGMASFPTLTMSVSK